MDWVPRVRQSTGLTVLVLSLIIPVCVWGGAAQCHKVTNVWDLVPAMRAQQ